MRDSEAVVTPFMQVATYATRNFAHTIPIFRSGMDFLFIQFAHMPYHHYVQMHKVHWIPNVKSLRIPKILASCGLSNLLYISVYKYQGSRIYPKIFSFIIQSLAYYCMQVSRFPHICIYVCIVQSFLLYTSIKSSKEFPAYSWVALFSYEKRRQYLP